MTLSATSNIVYLSALTQMSRLVEAGPDTFDAGLLIEDACALRSHLELQGILSHRFSSAISLFEDLAGDRMLTPGAAQAVWRQTQKNPTVGLIPGFMRLDAVGRGGFGTVYRAIDEETGRQAAVKVGRLSPKGASSDSIKRAATIEELLKAFEEEHALLRRFRSDRIVKVESQGLTARGKPYFILEYVSGGSLSGALRLIEKGDVDFTWKYFYRIVDQILEAACVVHEAGVLHNDFKPENFLVGREDTLKLADFSLAITIGAAKQRGARTPRGTPGYLSVQTTESFRSDVHKLGGTVYRILTGRTPALQHDALGALAAFVLGIKEPSRHRPERNIPPELDRFVMKALHRDPGARFQNAKEMLAAFRRLRPLRRARPV